MRLKEDNRSWNAHNVIRKNIRHTKDPDDTMKHRSKKNTAKWCKGKVGKKHLTHWVHIYSSTFDWYELICTVCNKVCDNWFTSSLFYGSMPLSLKTQLSKHKDTLGSTISTKNRAP